MRLFIGYFTLKAVGLISTQGKHDDGMKGKYRIQFRQFKLCSCDLCVCICVCKCVRPLHSNNLSHDSLTKKEIEKSCVLFCFFCFCFCFCIHVCTFMFLFVRSMAFWQWTSALSYWNSCSLSSWNAHLEVRDCFPSPHYAAPPVCVCLTLLGLSVLSCLLTHTRARAHTHTHTRLLACKCKAGNLTVVLGVWKASNKSVCKKNKDALLMQV